jgi:hypothetical protein
MEGMTKDSLVLHIFRALTAVDASELTSLLRVVEDSREQRLEMRLDETEMRLLAALLAETSRNLRLLKRLFGRADSAQIQALPMTIRQ